MKKEIERKFLIKSDDWKSLYTEYHSIDQGYLSDTTRIRIIDGRKAYITIKNNCTELIREEYEYEIPVDEACRIYKYICKKYITKRRYIIPINTYKIEVDVYNKDFVIAEIEYKSEEDIHKIILPDWILNSKEITGIKKYYNYNLAKKKYC